MQKSGILRGHASFSGLFCQVVKWAGPLFWFDTLEVPYRTVVENIHVNESKM